LAKDCYPDVWAGPYGQVLRPTVLCNEDFQHVDAFLKTTLLGVEVAHSLLVGSQPQALLLDSAAVRATRTVLFLDVVESVRLVEDDESSFVTRWLELVSYVKSVVLPECNGRFVKSLGDGMLLDFDDVRPAIAAAFAILHTCNRANLGLPPEQHLTLRMGMEIGNVILETDDIHGRGVNLAARLMNLAGPGEIIVSKHVRDRLTPELDADVEDLGDCFLRHLKEPVRAFRVGPPGPRPVLRSPLKFDDLAPAIAVVPFASRLPSAEGHALGDILAEEVIRSLSQSAELNVISRLSTTAFRERNTTTEEISAHLCADYVISGAYSAVDGTIILDAELAEAKSGRILWVGRLTEDVASLLSGSEELVGQLLSAVTSVVVTRELQRSKLQPLQTLKAYTLLMGAITLMHRLSLRDFEDSRHLLQSLIDRTGRHPTPQAWLANWHVLRVQQGWSVDPREDAHCALEYTKRALDTDPDCSLALAVDGFVHMNLLKRLDIARDRYSRAIISNPNNALAWLLKGTLHAFMDEGQQAVEDTQRALRLSPLDPHRYFYDSLAASAWISARQYEAALDSALSSMKANRKHTSTLRVLAVAQWHLGMEEEARQSARELLNLDPTLTVSRWLERAPSASFAVGKEFAKVLRLVGVPD
jgi:adenylate cyclase